MKKEPEVKNMIRINPAILVRFMGFLSELIERASSIPAPDKIQSYRTTPEENKTGFHIVVLKAAFRSEKDAQAFLKFNNKLDEALSGIQ